MTNLKGKDILSIADLNAEDINYVLELANELKSGKLEIQCNKTLGLLFYKASTRTRVSFSLAMYQMRGHVLDLSPSNTQVGRGEPISDTARVLDRYLDVLAIRTFKQADLQSFADYAEMPIINALTDLEHPCQILADLLTIKEHFGQVSDLTLTYLGDGNNVAHSLLLGGALMGMNIRVATPKNYQPNPEIVTKAKQLASKPEQIVITDDALAAVENAQVLYTDVWASMGQESEAQERISHFQPYQINQKLVSNAAKDAIVLHCLPAHREEEITNEVIESPKAKVWAQAENRMHAQKALIAAVLDLV